MTRVDFYLLDGDAAGGRDLTVCKLAHKVFQLGHRIYIFTAGNDESQRLDGLLWTFAAGSFIPHALTAAADAGMPVIIGHDTPPDACDDVLITLAPQVPECFSRFQRVAEVVGPNEQEKTQARERFRFYRERGYALQAHKIAGASATL